MIIGMSSTRNWYKYLLTNLFAILSNNKVDKFYLFIEDDYIDELDILKKRFNTEFICKNIDNNIFDKYIEKDCPNTNINTRFSRCSLSRILIPKEVNEDKILYLDVDALTIADISELWNIDLGDNYVAGTIDTNTMNLRNIDPSEPYINSGVLLMNLKLIRENHIDDKLLDMINNESLRYADQDAINAICKNHMYIFSEEFNSSTCTKLLDNKDDIKIIHYIMKKVDWVRNHKYSEIWYQYEDLYQKFKEEQA